MVQEHLPKDIKRIIFEITHALYRVTGLFPRGESLAAELRKESSDVLRECVKYGVLPESTFEDVMGIIAKIRGLRSLLWLARMNHFVTAANIDVLEREYRIIEHFFFEKLQVVRYGYNNRRIQEKREVNDTPKEKNTPDVYEKKTGRDMAMKKVVPNIVHNVARAKADKSETGKNSNRQAVIIQFLEKKDNSNIKDISNEFTGISTKTIQRDLQDLMEKNIVQRIGDRRWSVYSLSKRIEQE
jgi:hypothetical protein